MSSDSLSSAEADDDRPTIGLISNMEARADHQTTKRYRLLYGISTCLGVGLLVMALTWTLHFQKGFGWTDPSLEFNWHPLLMLTSLVFMYAQSMLIYRSARQARKKVLKLCHAGLHSLSFILAVIALKAAFDSHNYAVPPKANLYTLHSWVGLATVILFAYQFLCGFITFLFPGLSKEIRATYLPVHANFGIAIFFMAVVAAMMGLGEKAIWSVSGYDSFPSEGMLVNFMGMVLLCFGVLTLYLVNDATYKRSALPEEEISLTGHPE